MPGEGFEPPCPNGRAGLSRQRLTSFATRARGSTVDVHGRLPAQSTATSGYTSSCRSRIRRSPHARGSLSTQNPGRTARPYAVPTAPVRRAPRPDDAAREPGRLRGPGRPLPVAAAVVLPPHAGLQGGRRGRAPGGLRRGVQRDDGRRTAAERAAVAVPHRPQPQPQPPAPPARGRRRLDGHPSRRGRHHDGRQGPAPRGPAAAGLRRPGSRRDAAHRAAAARDRCAELRPDRRGDGDDNPGDQVAAGPGADVAGRGGRGARADVRRGSRRARRGRRGPEAYELAGAPPHQVVRALRGVQAICGPTTRRWPRSSRSRRCCCSRSLSSPTSVPATPRPPAARALLAQRRRPVARWPPAARCRPASARSPRRPPPGSPRSRSSARAPPRSSTCAIT